MTDDNNVTPLGAHPLLARAAMVADGIGLLLAGENEDTQRFALTRAMVVWAWCGQFPGVSGPEVAGRVDGDRIE